MYIAEIRRKPINCKETGHWTMWSVRRENIKRWDLGSMKDTNARNKWIL